MQIQSEYVDIPVAGKRMRTLVTQPVTPGRYPGIVYFSDIYQLGGPMQRACARLAGYGFVVAAHEIFHRREPSGTVLLPDDEGRTRGVQHQLATPVAHFDEDCRAVIGYLQQHPSVAADQLGAGGFCIGGHLAYRAALQPEIRAAVCFYPSWLHSGKLGQGEAADSLARATDIRGALLLVFGGRDALLPDEGRALLETTLQTAGVHFQSRLFPAEHAFMRDDRASFDPECADQAFAAAVEHFRRVLG